MTMASTLTLRELIGRAEVDRSGVAADARELGTVVTGLSYDSRSVQPGHAFVAVRGEHADGVVFAGQAHERGAVAVFAEAEAPAGHTIAWIRVPDARAALAALAAAFYADPSHELLVLGVTGTNGKTTTTYLLEAMLEHAGVQCGRVGSVSYRIGNNDETAEQEATRTTPEAPDLQALLRAMVERKCGACVMEVSSHALALRRVDGVRFGAGVFTNLTRDHLDFHGDTEGYFLAKRRLFEMLPEAAPAVLNADDPRGRSLVKLAGRPVTYALDGTADVAPTRRALTLGGIELDVRTPRGPLHLRSRLLGRGNAYNILAAVTTCVALDVPFRAIEEGIDAVELVPGRMQVVSNDADDITVVVDFAHTDDALRGLLETARLLGTGRLITVFGCGGDRDSSKRPLMGALAARLSDLLILTSDNPRSENPDHILREIELGLGDVPKTAWRSTVDRGEAIAEAIHGARSGDLVVIAGKGHERYQVVGARRVPFDDGAVGRAALARRRSRSRVR